MAQPLNPRVTEAFKAMRSLGISKETVKPVLKRLLKLYDRNWELIEEDNYRTLADAIFESQEEDKLKDEKKGNMINEDAGPLLKKPCRGDPEDQVSSTGGNGKSIIDTEESDLRKNSSGVKKVESSHSISGNLTSKPHHVGTKAPSGSKDKDPIQGTRAIYVDDEPVREMEIDERNRYAIVAREKQPVDQYPQFAIPPSPIQAGSTNISQHLDTVKEKIGSSSANNLQPKFQTTYDIASSTCGEVKVSLTCKRTASQHNFTIPSVDEVMSFAESISEKLCGIDGAQFSLVKLLNELCEHYSENGSDFDNQCPRDKTLGDSIHYSLKSSVDLIREDHQESQLGKKISSGFGPSVSRSPVAARPQLVDRSNKKRAFHIENDITNGTEKVKISLLDQIGNEDLPQFIYCPENTIYESAYVHVSLARIANDDCCKRCIGDCLSRSIPCACARDTGGEFAYTPDGLLSEKFLRSCISMKVSPDNQHLFYCQDCPLERAKNVTMPEKCKGHLLRKFIKECWQKCGCNMQCGNRVVQRGISRDLQVFLTSDGKGWGLRTLDELPAGAFVCEYVGEILTNIELYERNKKNKGKDKHVYPVLLDADWATEGVLKDEEALCLDATYYGNVARFINHRCFDGNVIEIPVQVETPDRHYYHLAFFTKRKVEALEEITWDYGIDFDDESHPIEAFQCSCGSQYCRDRRRKKGKEIVLGLDQ